MQGNRGRDTRPELALRRRAHAEGLRYRVGIRPIPAIRRTADLVFPNRKIAVFLDGCFWHRCEVHFKLPRTNRDYWSQKIARNVARDRDTDELLIAAGWTVIRVWEHEPPDAAVTRIQLVISRARLRAPD
jgi:DNA mismatch endonuclease (patch repair protein)